MGDALRWAGAFLAGFKSSQARRSYRRGLDCWFVFCASHGLHPYRELRRTHVEVNLRELEAQDPSPANATLYRRIATLSSWFRWLEDEGDDAYALTCLLGLNGLRVSEACNANVADLGGSRYQPTLQIMGKGDKPAEVVLNPRTQQALDLVVDGRTAGPLLRNRWRRRMQPHNAPAVLRRLGRAARITRRVTPHALPRSYITIGLSKECHCARCNARHGTARPIPPSATTSQTAPSTVTRPSSSWRRRLADPSASADTCRFIAATLGGACGAQRMMLA